MPMSLIPSSTIRYRTPGCAITSQSSRANAFGQAIRKQMVPANALIENGLVARGGPRLKAFCQHVRPTVVPVGRGAVPVGDRVSQDDNCPCVLRSCHIDS